MANAYVMPQAMVCNWDGESSFPNVDELSYRNVEGHGPEKAFRYNGFEKSRSANPNIFHTYQSDDYLRLSKLFQEGNLAVGDYFILGIAAPELTELDSLWVRQSNTVAGFGLDIKVKDFTFADVAPVIPVDFTNACDPVTGRWLVNPVQKQRFDNSANLLFTGENEVYWLVAEITSLPAAGDWFTECEESALPSFQVRAHYNDSCLSPEGHTCAPLDTHDEWVAAVAALADDIVIWSDIAVDKRKGGFQNLK